MSNEKLADYQRAHIQHLTDSLVKAKAQAEHFEREWYMRGDVMERQGAKIDALEAECEALRKDAERYRWLVANSFDKEGLTQMHCELHTWEPHSLTGLPTEWTQRVRGPAIDRLIDAAMGKETP